MNSKERVLRAISHKELDRIPSYFMSTNGINLKLAEKFGIEPSELSYLDPHHGDLTDRLGCDVRFVWPKAIRKPERRFFSCGSVHAAIHGETMVFEKMPLEDAKTVEEILNYAWPSPDWYDYTIPDRMLASCKDKAVCAYDMFILLLYAMGMRGMETLMMDMASEPEMAHAVFDKICEFHLVRLRRFLTVNKGIIDIVGIGDDVAGQNGMFFSPEMWREYIKPCLIKAVELCHEFNVIPYFHGCGGFSVLYRDFMEIGIHCTGRLQTEARGNHFATLKKEFGKELCLWGGIDGQHILVHGSVEDVKNHVHTLLMENYDKTGFIAGPTHSFTEDIPVENVLAVYEALSPRRNAK